MNVLYEVKTSFAFIYVYAMSKDAAFSKVLSLGVARSQICYAKPFALL